MDRQAGRQADKHVDASMEYLFRNTVLGHMQPMRLAFSWVCYKNPKQENCLWPKSLFPLGSRGGFPISINISINMQYEKFTWIFTKLHQTDRLFLFLPALG